MRVGLVTSWGEVCGIASWSQRLIEYTPGVDYKIIGRPFSPEQIIREAESCDIVHFSLEYGLLNNPQPWLAQALKDKGIKTMCTFHNIWPDTDKYGWVGDNYKASNPFVNALDAAVTPDPHAPFIYIPQGVLEVRTSSSIEKKIGTAGFPTGYKKAHLAAQIAHAIGFKMLLFAPVSQHADAHSMAYEVRRWVPDAEIIHSFPTQEYIAERLSECALTFWGYGSFEGQSGISGSVRLGIAARRPMVISRCGMYRDLHEGQFADEFHIVDDMNMTYENTLPKVLEAVHAPKLPLGCADFMSWRKCGDKYLQVYRSLV